jgi:hypothetical protein
MSDHAASKPSDHAGVRVPPPLIYGALAFLPVVPARAAALLLLGASVPLVVLAVQRLAITKALRRTAGIGHRWKLRSTRRN